MSERRILIAGGGAAGFFAAIACAEASPSSKVTLIEKGPQFLSKVRISGGGRCNVTHACFDPDVLTGSYPRGGSALLGPFYTFQSSDTMAWFESRGVQLKTEPDGRVFPVSDSSQSIIDCLLNSANAAGVELILNRGLQEAARSSDGFDLKLSNGAAARCDRLLLATGGCRALAAGQLAQSLGHTLEEPVPSLFTFQISSPWLRALAGISLKSAELSIPAIKLRESGNLLITHTGLSGPAVLRLSAWGARPLSQLGYKFKLRLNWLPHLHAESLGQELAQVRTTHSARRVVNTPIVPVPARLWEQLVLLSGISRETRWANLARSAQHQLIQQLSGTELDVVGKSLNKEEFVTCGGVRLPEVNFRTLESRVCPGLYFGGELLDIDGVTGGFNFQAAWTTGWIAGQAMGG